MDMLMNAEVAEFQRMLGFAAVGLAVLIAGLGWWRKRRKLGIGLAGVFLVVAAVIIPSAVPARTVAERNACIGNLRAIDGAKEQWALERRKERGAIPTEEEIYEPKTGGPFLRQRANCPSGGVYEIGAVGEMPKCSLAEAKGHSLGK